MQTPSVITVTLNPALDMTMRFHGPRLGELNRAERVLLEPSGKGVNVSRALQAQGVLAQTILPMGGPFGVMIQDALEAAHLPLLSVPIAGQTRCNVKVIDSDTGTSTEFNAPGPSITPDELEALKVILRATIAEEDLVVFSGSLPTGSPSSVYADLIGEVHAMGARAILDADRDALRDALPAHPYLVKPNRREAEELLEITIDTVDRALDAARRIQTRGAEHVVLSLGANGAIFLARSEAHLVLPPQLRPRGTVGSGDALLSGVVAALVRGWSWVEAARYATAVAAARTAMDGIDFPDRPEIEGYLERVQVVSLEVHS
jgi:1-phosphofructokinase family hexose kinase